MELLCVGLDAVNSFFCVVVLLVLVFWGARRSWTWIQYTCSCFVFCIVSRALANRLKCRR